MTLFQDRSAPGGISELLRLAGPLILATASSTLNHVCGHYFLSRAGDTALEAILSADLLAQLPALFLAAVLGYSATLGARFHGAQRPRMAFRSFAQGIWLTLFTAPLFLLFLPLGLRIIALSGHSPAASAAEASYFLLAEPGGLLTVLNAVLTGFLTAQGKTRFAGFAASVGCLAGIALNPLLIFGIGPLPALSISGAALANIGCGAVNGILLAFAILRDPLFAQGLRNHDGPFRFAFARPIVRLGLPRGFNTLSGAAAFTAFVFATGRLGGLPAAAGNVVFAVNGVFFCLLLALAPAVEILAGRARGAADIPTVRRICRSGLLLAGLALGLCYAVILPMSNVIMDAFRPTGSAFDPALWRHIGLVLFTILFFREIAESALLVLRGVLNGLGETRSVMRIQMFMDLLVWTPTVLLLMHTTHSVLAIWLTLPVNLAVTALLLHRRLRGATAERN